VLPTIVGLAVTASPVGKNQACLSVAPLAVVSEDTPTKLWWGSWP
jgi:hypothetical protein